ncbi:response regulator transcription factor [Paenibacillus alkaliterrae]|uniref:response regulator transcription factor n=1 Tax=Paenibacillus alkaliterrae TaxID=320909 RepID=UPI001F4851E4|nr:response regulator transcription factor [Paenibacillus alkaliterrae]MCF2940615.1 response regulator transcription factor [Paenibacillus alkaliterrae]
MRKIRIFLIDDDETWLSALKTFLENEVEFDIVGVASNKEDAMSFIENEPDIDTILLDINLTENNLDGIYVALEILESRQVDIIMLTSLDDADIIRNSFAAGASQFVSKMQYRSLPDIIRSLFIKVIDPTKIIAEEYRKFLKEHYLRDLTTEERKIYDLLEKGYTRTEIENTLVKSGNTLKIQIKSILKKIGVSNSKEALKKISRLGL